MSFQDNPDYLDPDDFLADTQRMPLWFHGDKADKPIPDEAHVLSPDGKIPRDVKMDAPWALARVLAEVGFARVNLPNCYSKKVQNDLQASAMNVDINLMNPYFFRFGVKLLQSIEVENLSQILHASLVRRAMFIIDFAQSSVFGGSVGNLSQESFLRGLDESEQKLFNMALETAIWMRNWEQTEQ